ncbi:MAG: (d)CMP kinase [Actinobacteria bacterium]|nr:(d)CMP kinase [Actinomycetota bacterium]
MKRALVVAIDGPSGSGKSSVSKGVAEHFSLAYLDTGAMYRAMTWFMLEQGVDLADPAAIGALADRPVISSGTDPRAPTISCNGVDVGEAIRSTEVTAAVSAVSAVPEVRHRLVDLQRAEIGASSGIVAEGRDIGTVVAPDADVKIFLIADPAVRAQRRAAENQQTRRSDESVAATEADLQRRDKLDSQRKASPLQAADDAHTLDATHLDLAQTIAAACEIVSEND